jgi:hypothetical protein
LAEKLIDLETLEGQVLDEILLPLRPEGRHLPLSEHAGNGHVRTAADDAHDRRRV